MIETGFKEFALSYSGMDGGNTDAPLWICGIEFGGQVSPDVKFEPVREMPFWSAKTRSDNLGKAKTSRDRYISWNYCRMASKLTVCVLSEVSCTEDLNSKWGWRSHYYEQEIDPEDQRKLADRGYCGKFGGNLSLNLYPINFPRLEDAHWSETHRQRTGFETQYHYKAWCVENRFMKLRELVSKLKPAAIVCTSAVDTRNDFRLAFCDPSLPLGDPITLSEQGKKKLVVYKVSGNDGTTTVWIVPFLGQGGIMADRAIIRLGGMIRDDILERDRHRLDGFWPPACELDTVPSATNVAGFADGI